MKKEHPPKKENRISWDEYYMEMVRLIAKRGTCPRKRVGAIIVDQQNRIVGSGYNGAPKGMSHCTDVGCLIIKDGKNNHCIRTIHAEQNALLQAGRQAQGSTLYCTTLPCPICFKLCIQAGIRKIAYYEDYNKSDLNYWVRYGEILLVQWRGPEKRL
jgi:dCMP deaminase